MKYADIPDQTDNKKARRQKARRLRLYSEIWRDIVTIIRILVPGAQADKITTRAKGIMVNIIELKTGKRPDKF